MSPAGEGEDSISTRGWKSVAPVEPHERLAPGDGQRKRGGGARCVYNLFRRNILTGCPSLFLTAVRGGGKIYSHTCVICTVQFPPSLFSFDFLSANNSSVFSCVLEGEDFLRLQSDPLSFLLVGRRLPPMQMQEERKMPFSLSSSFKRITNRGRSREASHILSPSSSCFFYPAGWATHKLASLHHVDSLYRPPPSFNHSKCYDGGGGRSKSNKESPFYFAGRSLNLPATNGVSPHST